MTKKRALAGIKVLEHAQLVAGPYCGKLLADLGAEVIKIEYPGTGDDSRRRGPFPHDIPHPERSALFQNLNTNKLGITLNLGSTIGIDLFKRLVKGVDILIEDQSPHKMRQIGLNLERLEQINRRLVITSITPFGQTGPHAGYKAYDLNTFHSGGLGYLTPCRYNDLEKPPLRIGGAFADYTSGLIAAMGTLAALYVQRITGVGQQVDISKQESVIDQARILAVQYPNTGKSDDRKTTSILGISEMVPCKDGHVIFTIAETHHWHACVKFMGNPEWATDERLEDPTERSIRARTDIRAHLMEFAKGYTKRELYHKGQEANVPIMPVMSAEEVVKSPQYQARGFFVRAPDSEGNEIMYPGAPFKFSETPWSIERPAPGLGQHNEMIYCERNGFSKQELVAMRQAGVV